MDVNDRVSFLSAGRAAGWLTDGGATSGCLWSRLRDSLYEPRCFSVFPCAPLSRGIPAGVALVSPLSSRLGAVFRGSDFSRDAWGFTPLCGAASMPFFKRLPPLVTPAKAGVQFFSRLRSRARSFVARHPCLGFTRLRASESLFFACSKKSNQKKEHPAIAPYAQSLCYGCARPLRGSPTVRPWTDVELAHIVWATLRADPAQPRRDRGAPLSAHRARQRRSRSQSPHPPCRAPSPAAREKEGQEPKRMLRARRNLLRLGCAGCAVNGAPMQRQRDVGKARRVARMDASQFDVSPGTDCRRTAGVALRSRRAGARRPLHRGGLLFGYFLLATQEKVTRAPQACESFFFRTRRKTSLNPQIHSTHTTMSRAQARNSKSPVCAERQSIQ